MHAKPLRSLLPLLLLAALLGSPAVAEDATPALRLGSPFGEGMVVQADKPVRVWGEDEPGAEVTVAFAGASATATADGAGAWRVELPAVRAEDEGPHEMTVRGSSEVTLGDVLVGEVWWCSGQSNMVWRLSRIDADPALIAAEPENELRFLRLPFRSSDEPEAYIDASWEVSSPESRPPFSAVAYFFGRKLRAELDRPVGLVVGAGAARRSRPGCPRTF